MALQASPPPAARSPAQGWSEGTMTDSNYGVCLNRVRDGVAIMPTKRADLHMDRLAYQLDHAAAVKAMISAGAVRPITPPTLLALVGCPSVRAAALVASVLNQFWKNHGRVLLDQVVISEQDAALTIDVCSRTWGLQPLAHAPVRAVKPGPHRHDVIAWEEVPDPSMSPAEYWHRLAQGEEIEQFSTILAPINLTTLMGGLALLPKRQEIHEMAAETYRTLYERVMLMGNPRAIDYGSAVQVDNSRSLAPFLGGAEDASDRYKYAVRVLGQMRASVVDPIVLHDESVASVARRRHGNAGGQARKRVTAELHQGLDILGVHFGLSGKSGARAKVTGWYDTRLPLELPVT
jgi:hypothetical protein